MAEYRRGDKLSWMFMGAVIGFLLGMAFAAFSALFVYRSVVKIKPDIRRESETISKSILHLSFEDKDELYVIKPSEFALAEISEDYASVGNRSLLVKMRAGMGFPGIGWAAQGRESLDFSQAKGFGFDVYNPTDYFVKLEVKFKSGFEERQASSSLQITLKPYEWNKVFIPTDRIAQNCNPREISYVKIFPVFPAQDMALYFDNFRLE